MTNENGELEAIAGGPGVNIHQVDRAASIRALLPVIDQLLSQGREPAAIIAALAELSVKIIDRRPQPPASNANGAG